MQTATELRIAEVSSVQGRHGTGSLACFEEVESAQCFGGTQLTLAHDSQITGTRMRISVFLPPAAKAGPVPAVFYLSGLICTEENFTVKAGAQRMAAECGLIVVAPDTSPRGDGVANTPDYDLGQGVGFSSTMRVRLRIQRSSDWPILETMVIGTVAASSAR